MMPGIGMMSYDAWYWDDGVLAGPRAVVFRALSIIHLLCVSSLSSLRVSEIFSCQLIPTSNENIQQSQFG